MIVDFDKDGSDNEAYEDSDDEGPDHDKLNKEFYGEESSSEPEDPF